MKKRVGRALRRLAKRIENSGAPPQPAPARVPARAPERAPEPPAHPAYVEGQAVVYTRDLREGLVAAGAVISPSAHFAREDVVLHHPVSIAPHCSLGHAARVGKFSFINWYSILFPNVTVGAFCAIGRDVHIGLAMHPTDWLSTHTFQYGKGYFPHFPGYDAVKRKRHLMHRPTVIGNDVWIGNKASIAAGVTVGDGATLDVDAVHGRVDLPHPSQHDAGEGFIDLDRVHMLDAQAGLFKDRVGRWNRARERKLGIAAHRNTPDDSGAFAQAEFIRLRFRSQKERGGAVRNLTAVARRDHAVFLEDRSQRRHLLRIDRGSDPFVPIHHCFFLHSRCLMICRGRILADTRSNSSPCSAKP